MRRLYRKHENGPWYGQYYGPAGQRIQVCTKCWDRRAAESVLRQFERQASAAPGVSKNAPTQTVAEALQYLVAQGCSDCAPATLAMYAQMADISCGCLE